MTYDRLRSSGPVSTRYAFFIPGYFAVAKRVKTGRDYSWQCFIPCVLRYLYTVVILESVERKRVT